MEGMYGSGLEVMLVVGAASGIGKAVAIKFYLNGFNVICADQDDIQLQILVE